MPRASGRPESSRGRSRSRRSADASERRHGESGQACSAARRSFRRSAGGWLEGRTVSADINRRFRDRIARRDTILLPGAANALAARVIADLGFEAVYVTGAGIANTLLGVPDLGLVGLSELVQHTGAICDAVDLPVIVDADTGFGNALNVRHTVRALE